MSITISGVNLTQPLSDPGISPNGNFTMGGQLTTQGAGGWADTGIMHFQWDQGTVSWTDLASTGALNIAAQTNPITGLQDTNEHTITVYNDGTTGTFNIRIYVIDEDLDEYYSSTQEIVVASGEQTLDVTDSILSLNGSDHPANAIQTDIAAVDSELAVDGSDHPDLIFNLNVQSSNIGLSGADHPIVMVVNLHRWTDDEAFEFIDDEVEFEPQELQPDIYNSILGHIVDIPELSTTGERILSVENSNHELFNTNQNLTKNQQFSIVNSGHDFNGSDHPELSTGASKVLSLLDPEHGLSRSECSLTLLTTVSVDDTAHSFTRSETTIQPDRVLSSVDSELSQSGGHPELTIGGGQTLSIINAQHGLSGTHPTIATSGEQTLSVVSSRHGLVGEFVDLSAVEVRWIDDDGVEFIDTPTDFVPHEVWLNPVDSIHGQVSEVIVVTIGAEKILGIQASSHKTVSDQLVLTVHEIQSLSVINPNHTQFNSNQILNISAGISCSDSIHKISGTHPTIAISGEETISPINTCHGLSGTHPELIISAEETLSITSSRHSLSGTHPGITTPGEQTLSIISSRHSFISELVNLSAEEVRWIDDDGVEFIDTPTDFVPHEVWLNPVDSLHGQVSEVIVVTLGLDINRVSHSLVSGKPDINVAGDQALSPRSSIHNIVSEIGSISAGLLVSVNNTSHELVAEIPENSTTKIVDGSDSIVGHIADTISINLEIECLVTNTIHGHKSEEIYLSKNTEKVLTPQDAIHRKTVETLRVTKWTSLGIIDSQTGHRVDSVFVRYNGLVNGIDSVLAIESEKITVNFRCLLTATDSIHGVQSIPFELILSGDLVVTDSIIGITAESANLNLNNEIIPVETSHDVNSTVSINSNNKLVTVDSVLIQEVSRVVLGASLEIISPTHELRSDNVEVAFVIYPFKTFVANDEEYFYMGRSTAYNFTAKDMLKRAA